MCLTIALQSYFVSFTQYKFYKENRQYLCKVDNLIHWTDRDVEWIPCGEDHGMPGHNADCGLDKMKSS
jgi:hypothetical protein